MESLAAYGLYEYPTFQQINNPSAPNLKSAKDEFYEFLKHTTVKKLKNLLVAGQHRLLEYQEAAQRYGTKDAIDATPENIAIYAIAIFEELLGPNTKPPYVVSMDTLQTRAKRDAKDSTLGWVADAFYNILDKNDHKKSLGLYDLLWTRYNNRQKPLGTALSLDRYPEAVQEYARWARINSVEKGNDEWQKQFKNKAQLWKDAFGELSDHQKRALARILLEHAGTLYCQVDFFKILVEGAKNISMKPSQAIQQALEDVSNQLAAPPSHKEPTDDREAAAILKTMVYRQENTL